MLFEKPELLAIRVLWFPRAMWAQTHLKGKWIPAHWGFFPCWLPVGFQIQLTSLPAGILLYDPFLTVSQSQPNYFYLIVKVLKFTNNQLKTKQKYWAQSYPCFYTTLTLAICWVMGAEQVLAQPWLTEGVSLWITVAGMRAGWEQAENHCSVVCNFSIIYSPSLLYM